MTVTRNKRNRIVGTVIGDKMHKTITVSVERTYRHAKYGKYIRRHTKYHAHDEHNEAHVGDRVELLECRPLSRIKRFRLLRVTERAGEATSDAVLGGEA